MFFLLLIQNFDKEKKQLNPNFYTLSLINFKDIS